MPMTLKFYGQDGHDTWKLYLKKSNQLDLVLIGYPGFERYHTGLVLFHTSQR